MIFFLIHHLLIKGKCVYFLFHDKQTKCCTCVRRLINIDVRMFILMNFFLYNIEYRVGVIELNIELILLTSSTDVSVLKDTISYGFGYEIFWHKNNFVFIKNNQTFLHPITFFLFALKPQQNIGVFLVQTNLKSALREIHGTFYCSLKNFFLIYTFCY